MSAKPENERDELIALLKSHIVVDGHGLGYIVKGLGTAADAIIAQRESGGAEPVAWRSIDSAPQDGTKVRLMDALGEEHRAWWSLCDAPERGVLGVMAWAMTPKDFRPILWAPAASQVLAEPVACSKCGNADLMLCDCSLPGGSVPAEAQARVVARASAMVSARSQAENAAFNLRQSGNATVEDAARAFDNIAETLTAALQPQQEA